MPRCHPWTSSKGDVLGSGVKLHGDVWTKIPFGVMAWGCFIPTPASPKCWIQWFRTLRGRYMYSWSIDIQKVFLNCLTASSSYWGMHVLPSFLGLKVVFLFVYFLSTILYDSMHQGSSELRFSNWIWMVATGNLSATISSQFVVLCFSLLFVPWQQKQNLEVENTNRKHLKANLCSILCSILVHVCWLNSGKCFTILFFLLSFFWTIEVWVVLH